LIAKAYLLKEDIKDRMIVLEEGTFGQFCGDVLPEEHRLQKQHQRLSEQNFKLKKELLRLKVEYKNVQEDHYDLKEQVELLDAFRLVRTTFYFYVNQPL
jgi:hypothetical protein